MKNLLMLVSMLVLVSCGGAGGKAGGSTPAATAPDPFVENGYACEGVDKRVKGDDYDAKFSFENLAVVYVRSDRRDANGLTLPEDFYLEIAEPPTCVYNNTVANGSKLLLTFTDKPAERCEWFYSDVDHKFEFDRC
ncbi:MAG: hypothetical protein K0U41_08330, partial [Gammaproteobacteria bacterium]|nr:hypothetical protein [Gammaproteobacteria bacterium]